jgi:electron transfer flavoprotein alpha subunit
MLGTLEAPAFAIANHAIVGDLFEAVAALLEEVRKASG